MNKIIILACLLFSLPTLYASHDEKDYVMVSRKNSNENFVNVIHNSSNQAQASENDMHHINRDDFNDVAKDQQKCEEAIHEGNKKSLRQIARLGYVANGCTVCSMVLGVAGGPLSFIPQALGSAAGVWAFEISYKNRSRNKRMQDQIEAAQKARDYLFLQGVDCQDKVLQDAKKE